MVERPINFAPVELLAELSLGRTQIRRPMLRQPPPGAIARLIEGSITAEVITPGRPDGHGGTSLSRTHWSEHCPYGRDGDYLWVRESWKVIRDGGTPDANNDTDCTIRYEVDQRTQDFNTGKQLFSASERRRPAAHLPRWASRIRYIIEDVGIQRLHQISEREAAEEGVTLSYPVTSCQEAMRYFWQDARLGHWSDNPWVWVLKVRCLKSPRLTLRAAPRA